MADYFESGFAVRKPSWHAKEMLLAEAPTPATWRTAAGVEWEPVKVPLYLPAPIVGIDDAGVATFGPARPAGSYALVRNDRIDALSDDDTRVRDAAILNRSVSEEYTPIEHERDMTPLIEILFDAAKAMGTTAEFTTAGAVRDGKQVYACLLLDRPFTIPGDPSLTLPHAVLMNSHDGSTACRGGLTAVRVVCANTYAMADSDLEGHGFYFKVRHSGDTQTRLEEAKVAVAGWLEAMDRYVEACTFLAGLPVSDDDLESWIDEFLPVVPGRMTDRQMERRLVEQNEFRSLYEYSDTTDGIRGSGYGLWQATVEYLDHGRAWRTADSYLRRTLLEPVPAKALARQRIEDLLTAGV